MSRQQSKDRRIGNCMMVIALIFGILVMGAQTQAQNQSKSQMGDMPYDLHFIDMMIMHHRHGTAMARLAERKGSTATLKAFAKKTADDQEKDLLELKKHRDHWYAGAPEMDHTQMMAMMGMTGHANMKMDIQGDTAKLQAAMGKQFDRLFLDMMIPHHQMAIDMAKDATTKAEHAEIKTMAGLTVRKQQGEIAEMNKLKASLGATVGKTATRKKTRSKPTSTHSPHAGH